MDREIKVTKCGELQGCELNDRISIELSPYDITKLSYAFRPNALEFKNGYLEQEDVRELYLVFTTAREIWEKERREKDK